VAKPHTYCQAIAAKLFFRKEMIGHSRHEVRWHCVQFWERLNKAFEKLGRD
jgi:hypothetical protein